MLGIFVSSLGLTLGVLVLALDITLQVLGSTFKRVIVVDGLVDDNCANSGSDSDQNLQTRQQRSAPNTRGSHDMATLQESQIKRLRKLLLQTECRGGKVFIQSCKI